MCFALCLDRRDTVFHRRRSRQTESGDSHPWNTFTAGTHDVLAQFFLNDSFWVLIGLTWQS